MRKTLLALSTLLFCSVLSAQNNYMVKLKVHDNEELLGSPSIVIEENKQANISVGNIYKVSLTVKEHKNNSVYVPFKLNIKGKEHAPSLVIELGKEASIKIGKMQLFVIVSKTRT